MARCLVWTNSLTLARTRLHLGGIEFAVLGHTLYGRWAVICDPASGYIDSTDYGDLSGYPDTRLTI